MEFCRRFIKRINHVHIKDVSESLAAAARGKETGIAVSHCAIGDGVNAENIRKVLGLLRDSGYRGVLSMECEGQGGPLDREVPRLAAPHPGGTRHSRGKIIPREEN